MTPEEIKKEIDALIEIRKNAMSRICELRNECSHEQTFEGNWSMRIGNIKKAKICSHCGELIKFI